jgi:hypothetical protein
MSSSDQDCSADERFERLLIDSAQRDEVPGNVDAAWQKFDSALNHASLLAAGAGGALAVRRAQRWLTAKCLIWGALTGSALTALSLRANHDRRSEASVLPSGPLAVSAAVSSAPPSTRSEAESQPRAAATTTSAQKLLPHSSRPHTKVLPNEPAPSESSTLSAQIALLDAARTAVAAGASADALRLADRYREEFPNGELAPEAEVVAIEALVKRGDRQPAALRAARFLARYPGDPHTARVKWLVR